MRGVLVICIFVLLVLAPIGVARAPKPWHRAGLMFVLGLFILLFLQMVYHAQRKVINCELQDVEAA